MRTTVTLDEDVTALVQRLMRDRNLSFKDALNQAIRAGLQASARPRRPAPSTRPSALGSPVVPLTKALRLSGEIEDEELVRRLATHK